jgi:hypothetical protein
MIPRITLRKALSDKMLLGSILKGASWRAWRVMLMAALGEALHDDERQIFKQLTSREHEPGRLVEEFVVISGRRGGKSRSISVLATYIAGLCHHPYLVPGETGTLLIIAPDQKQSDLVLDYVDAAFQNSPMLRQLVKNRTARTLELTSHITVEVRAANFRNLRGPTCIAVIADEVAFFRNEESANADIDILNAVRPSLATTRGPLILISSPYARRGVLWDAYSKYYGADIDSAVLVAKGASKDFNPALLQSVIDRAYERDHAAASAEFGGEFRTDVESFVSREIIDAAVVPGRYELPPSSDISYVGFTDVSGGSNDAMTLAIAHAEGDRIVLDAVRERKAPFSPDEVTAEFATTFKSYKVTSIRGDRYSGLWARERFAVHGIEYLLADKPKSDIYRDLLPLLNSGRVELLNNKRLISQLTGLERRTARGGRDSIDHAPGAHDDIANAVAGAVVTLASRVSQEVPLVTPIIISKPRSVPGGSVRGPVLAPHLGGY